LGCGRATALGQLEEALPSANFHGFNFKHEPEHANLKRTEVKIGDWRQLAKHYGPESMDFVYWNHGHEHEAKTGLVFAQLKRILRPKGRLIFNLNPDEANHPRMLGMVERDLKKAGFKVLRIFDTTSVTSPMFYNPRTGKASPGDPVTVGSKSYYVEKVK